MIAQNDAADPPAVLVGAQGLGEFLGHPTVDEFPNVKRIADAVMPRRSVQLVYEEWIAEHAG